VGTTKLPRHGTIRRYKLELAEGQTCEKCRAANSRAKAAERANKKAREQRAGLHIVPDPPSAPTDEPTDAVPPTKTTHLPRDVRTDVGGGIENAVRNYLNSAGTQDLLAHVYGEIVIAVARVISTAEPKDIPKLTEEMVDAAKLMRPADSTAGGSDDPFAGLGVAT